MWKKKEKTQQDYIKQLDAVFSKFIRLRDSFVKWEWRRVKCPLCWSIIPREKAQNMHFISRGVRKYRFDEMNCHAGCYRCNVLLKWNYIVYTRRMQNKYGIEKIDEMIADKSICKYYNWELIDKINEYTEKCKEITDKTEWRDVLEERLVQQDTLFGNIGDGRKRGNKDTIKCSKKWRSKVQKPY